MKIKSIIATEIARKPHFFSQKKESEKIYTKLVQEKRFSRLANAGKGKRLAW